MNSLASCSDVVRLWETGSGLELRRTANVPASATNSCCWNHNGERERAGSGLGGKSGDTCASK